jgi:serine/threonine protein kinase
MIGKGSCSSVFKAKCIICGKLVAIKESDKKYLEAKKNTKRLKNEIKLHSKLDHPNIIKIYGHFEDDVSQYMILELCE